MCKNATKRNNERCLTTSSLSSRTQKPNTENQTARGSQCAKSQRSFLSPKSKKEVNHNDKTENPRPAPSRKGSEPKRSLHRNSYRILNAQYRSQQHRLTVRKQIGKSRKALRINFRRALRLYNRALQRLKAPQSDNAAGQHSFCRIQWRQQGNSRCRPCSGCIHRPKQACRFAA